MDAPDECSTRPLDASEMSAWHALIRAHSRVVRRLEAELEAEHGLSLPAYEVLAHLSEAPEQRLRMTELAKHAILTPSGLTRLVDKLSRDGLVERQRCGADARVVYAVLTPVGMAPAGRRLPDPRARGPRALPGLALGRARRTPSPTRSGILPAPAAQEACLEALATPTSTRR